MFYANTCHPDYFDSSTFVSGDNCLEAVTESKTATGTITNITKIADSSMLYVSFEICGNYDATLFQYWYTASYTVSIKFINIGNQLQMRFLWNTTLETTVIIAPDKWLRIDMEFDRKAGVINFYVDGVLTCTTSGTSITKNECRYLSFGAFNSSSGIDKIRNIIVTDERPTLNLKIQDVEPAVENSEWTESDGAYSADEPNKSFTIKPLSIAAPDGYKVSNVLFGGRVTLSDTVKSMEVTDGKTTVTQNANGIISAVFDDISNGITVSSRG